MAMIPFTIGTIFGVAIPSAIYSAHLTHFPITHNVEESGGQVLVFFFFFFFKNQFSNILFQNYSEIWVCLPEMPDNVIAFLKTFLFIHFRCSIYSLNIRFSSGSWYHLSSCLFVIFYSSTMFERRSSIGKVGNISFLQPGK